MGNMENWLALRRLEQKLRQDIERTLSKLSHPITSNELQTLYFLNESQGQKLQISEISEKIDLSVSATSRMLVRFEKNCGVIERHICVDDKRIVEIKLTNLGKERLTEGLATIAPILEKYKTTLETFKNN